ncbi:MAG TPA: hypothetical protein VGD57_06215 [Candidatus Dormibacteraeota bacterium]
MARPPDACPYPKPFPADFDDCPAFQPRQFIPLDTLYQPLQPVLTCRHLETRALRERYRWYGACALGDAEARRRWAIEVGSNRLARISELQRQMGQAIGSDMQRLWQLKGQQLQAYRNGSDASALTTELRELSDHGIGELTSYLGSHSELLAEVGVPLDTMIQLTRLAFDRFIEGRHSSEVTFEVPDGVLNGLSEPVRTFFRPARPEAQAPLS